MFEITEIRIRKFDSPKSKIKAFVDITINNSLAIKNLKVIDGSKGLFLSMPSTKNKEGGFDDIVFPINNEARKYMTDTILKEYKSNEGNSNIF